MYFFIDTEFTDFKQCELISLGIVSENGEHEFYVEINDYDRSLSSDFVNQTVVPLLDNEKFGMSYYDAAVALQAWIDEIADDSFIVVVDYTGDWQLMSELMRVSFPHQKVYARMLQQALLGALHERGFHMPAQHSKAFSGLFKGIADYYNIDRRQHHALVDAKANRHGWLEAFKYAEQ